SACSVSSPGMRGIARSSSSTSGSRWATSFNASSPSLAVPTTRRSGLVSRSLMRPSRKIGWSSATTMRMGWYGLSVDRMARERNGNFETRALARIGFDGELAAEQPHALLYHPGPFLCLREVSLRQATRERKTASVVLDQDDTTSVDGREPDQHVPGPTVLAH